MLKKQKIEGQYMTPKKIVTIILDSIGYDNNSILNKKIIEPSFGDGIFLETITERIIEIGKNNQLSNIEISKIIEHNVYGIEKDDILYHKTINRLNNILSKNNIPIFEWKHLYNNDTLILYKDFINKFDYVVGNPPFVRIHNIPMEYRDVIKDFKFTNGMIDLYIVFYEIGMELLNDTGKLGYISPNSFLKNTSQKDFRQYLIDNQYISKLYDFKNSKLFLDADTYTCICILDKNKDRQNLEIEYKEFDMYQEVANNELEYEYFKNLFYEKPWTLHSKENMLFLEKNKQLKNKLSDIALVQNGIATNKDEAYIIKVFEDIELIKPYYGTYNNTNKIVYFAHNNKVFPVESKILHRCVKASRYEGIMDNTYIIFPYYYENHICISLKEEELKNNFPNAYQYLYSIKDELLKRDMEKNIEWFLFARSQGLKNSYQPKIVFKHIIDRKNPKIIPYILEKDVIVYSGIFTTTNQPHKVNEIFKSNDFSRYCSLMGKDMSGGYVHISTKIIKDFKY